MKLPALLSSWRRKREKPRRWGRITALDPARKTLLVVSHEASKTGAPIIALNLVEGLRNRYNVVSVLLRGGELLESFIASCAMCQLAPRAGKGVMRSLIAQVKPDIALVNSTASWPAVSALSDASIPVVYLIHEFATQIRPRTVIPDIVRAATHVVFSAPLVLADARASMAELISEDRVHVLAQGRCIVAGDPEIERIREALQPPGTPRRRVIMGAGTVDMRKGCDLFVQCAQAMFKRAPSSDVHFVWIGHGFDPEADRAYSTYLSEQVSRSGLDGRVTFMGALASMEAAYAEADIFLLTSRLDPLPNVGIDAMCAGVPVLCFKGSTGIADILEEEGLGALCVAPYCDTSTMAEFVLRILDDRDIETEMRGRLAEIGRRRFDMDQYIASIDILLQDAISESAR